MVGFFKPYDEYGYLSNWYVSDMVIDGRHYFCVEQYMMYKKALLFGDLDVANEILDATDPKTIKGLGRKVSNFDEDTWDKHKYQIVLKGVAKKFECNSILRKKLLEFPRDTVFVECSPYDLVWGCGSSRCSRYWQFPDGWRGQNLLGKIIMEVRQSYEG